MAATRSNGGPASSVGGAHDPAQLTARVQELSDHLAQAGDPGVRALAEELVGSVVELYGVGIERIFDALDDAGEAGAELRARLSEDGVVASLMLVHGLYPVDLPARVVEALDSVRPYMESHGGDVELLGIEDGVARIRLEGSCEGCPASASTLELAIKSALDEAAPDLEGLVVEGALATPAGGGDASGLELPVIQAAPGASPAQPTWFDLAEADSVGEGVLATLSVRDVEMVVARVEGDLLAFRNTCPGCGGSLAGGSLDEGVLACPGCERRYYLPRAGRSVDDDRLLLEPVPLLVGAQGPRVALPA